MRALSIVRRRRRVIRILSESSACIMAVRRTGSASPSKPNAPAFSGRVGAR